MADDKEKKDPDSGASKLSGDFKDIGAIDATDWSSALDEWDTSFEDADNAEEPSEPLIPAALDAAPAEATDDEVAVSTEALDEPPEERAESLAVRGGAPELSPELDFLSKGDFELEIGESEALGEMLGGSGVDDERLSPTPSRPSIPGLGDLVPETSDDVELPPAPTDDEVFGYEAHESETADSTPERVVEDVISEAQVMLARQLKATASKEFEESTRMLDADDQQRLAKEAMGSPAEDGEFEESTRLVSAEDQLRMATAMEKVDEEEREVVVTVDDEFYDSISIEDQAGGGDEAHKDEPAEPKEPKPVLEPPAAEETKERPFMAVPPDARRDDEDRTPVPQEDPVSAGAGDFTAQDSTPVPGGVAEEDAEAAAAGSTSELSIEAEVPPPGEAQELSFEAEVPPPGEAQELSFVAEPSGEEHGAPDEELAEIGVNMDRLLDAMDDQIAHDKEDPHPAAQPAVAVREEKDSTEDDRLSSLDAMLGISSDPSGGAAQVEPEVESVAAPKGVEPAAAAEPDLASLDALLGIGDSGAARGPSASAVAAPAPVGRPTAEGERATLYGWALPDPPQERALAELESLARKETQPTSLPSFAFETELAALPDVGAIPESSERAETSAERWESIVELLGAQVEAAADPTVAATLEAAAGTLLEFRLERRDEALSRYYEADAHHAGFPAARRAILRCGLLSSDWGGALESLEVLRKSDVEAERGAYSGLAADLLLAAMGDGERSAEIYTAMLDEPGVTIAGLLGLSDVSVFSGDTSLFASSMRRLSELIEAPEMVAPVALEAGRRLEALEEDESAAVCYKRATEPAGDVAQAALDSLARLAARAGRWEEVATRLRSLVAQIDPGAKRSDSAVRLHRVLLRRLEQPEETLAVAEGAAKEAPERFAIQVRLARLCEELGRWERAAAVWQQAEDAVTDPHLKGLAQYSAGAVCERKLQDVEAGLERYRACLEHDSSMAPAALAVGDLLGRSAESAARIDAQIARATAAREPADEAAYRILAAREMVAADRSADAMQLLASARGGGLDHRGLLRDLAAIAVTQEDVEQAVEVLLQLAEQLEPAAAAAVRRRAARLLVGSTEERRDEAYRRVAETDPELLALRWGEQRALCAAGREDAWRQAVAAEAEVTANAARGARLWRALGWSRSWQDVGTDAADAFEHAIGLASSDIVSRQALARASADQERWEVYARQMQEASDAAPTACQAALLRLRQAVCLEQKIGAADRATECYRELGDRFPSWRLPLDTLVRLQRWSGDRLQTAAVLKAQARQATQGPERVALMILAAAELDLGGDSEAATQVLAEAAKISDKDPIVQVPFAHLEAELGNWAALTDKALSVAKDAQDDQARLHAYEELARIDRDGRDDFPSAILGYESILRLDPAHHSALRELELHYPAEKRFDELGDICAKIAAATQGAERASNALEWARLKSSHSSQEVIRALRFAADADATSLYALARLEDHALRQGARDELLKIYRALSTQFQESPEAQAVFLTRAAESGIAADDPEAAGEAIAAACAAAPSYLPAAEERLRLALLAEHWPEAVTAAEALAEARRRPRSQAEARMLAGAVAQQKTEEPERAIANFQAVIELGGADIGAFGRLRTLYEQRGEWGQLARLINARLEEAGSGRSFCQLLWDLAQIEREQLDDPSSAKVTLKRLISTDGSHLEALRAATELYEADEQWVEVADMLIRQAKLEKDQSLLSAIFFQLGVLYDEKIPDPKRAVASYSKVVSLDPKNLPALVRLSSIHIRGQEWKPALAVTGRLVETELNPERRIGHLITLSKILEEGYRDPRRAREALLKAVEVDPLSLEAVGELATFYTRQNDRRSLMVHLDRSVTNVRAQLIQDPFQPGPYHSLLKLFEWRRAPDQQACAAEALLALGYGSAREKEILSVAGGGKPRWEALADPEFDEILYPSSVISGFRHTMRLLGGVLGKPYRGELSEYGVGRDTKLPKTGHPLRDAINRVGGQMGGTAVEIHVVDERPTVLVVEPYDPPVMIVGSALVEGAGKAELTFLAGRCLKLVQSNMVVAAKLEPEQLRALVAGIVRQYMTDFEPAEVPPAELLERTKLVSKALSRKLKPELMPFAMECAGVSDYAQVSQDLEAMSDQAGLLACGDLQAALSVLLRKSGKSPDKEAFAKAAKGNVEILRLLRFAVSEEYFDLRRRIGIASGSGPGL
ncbi:MAG: hypothetical protein ABI333_03760 [bacterium]